MAAKHEICRCSKCQEDRLLQVRITAEAVILSFLPRPAWWSAGQLALLKDIVNQINLMWSFGARVVWLETLEAHVTAARSDEDRKAVDRMLEDAAEQYIHRLEGYIDETYDTAERWMDRIAKIRSQLSHPDPKAAAVN